MLDIYALPISSTMGVHVQDYTPATTEGTAVSVEVALRGGFVELEVEAAGAGRPSLSSSSIALRPSSVNIGIPLSISFSKYFGTNLEVDSNDITVVSNSKPLGRRVI